MHIFVLLLIYVVFALISAFQVAGFFIGYTGSFGNDEFWNTGNFWAWIFMFIIISVVCLFIKIAAVLVNRLVFAIARSFNNAAGGILVIVLIIGWVIASIVGGINLFNWFASFPELTDWFTKGNWIGCILLIIGVWGLVARVKLDDD
jgi:hypothetical protein